MYLFTFITDTKCKLLHNETLGCFLAEDKFENTILLRSETSHTAPARHKVVIVFQIYDVA